MRLASVWTDAATHLRHMTPTRSTIRLLGASGANALHAVEEDGDVVPPAWRGGFVSTGWMSTRAVT